MACDTALENVALLGRVARSLLDNGDLKMQRTGLYYRLRAAAYILAHHDMAPAELERLLADDLRCGLPTEAHDKMEPVE